MRKAEDVDEDADPMAERVQQRRIQQQQQRPHADAFQGPSDFRSRMLDQQQARDQQQKEREEKQQERLRERQQQQPTSQETREEATRRAKQLAEEQRRKRAAQKDAEEQKDQQPRRKRGRWDDAPDPEASSSSQPDSSSKFVEDESERAANPAHFDATPVGNVGLETPASASQMSQQPLGSETPSSASSLGGRNRYLTDQELNAIFPSAGYIILEPPAGYIPLEPPPSAGSATPVGFTMQESSFMPTAGDVGDTVPDIPGMAGAGITRFSPDDAQNFAKLMDTSKPEEDMELEELKERKVLRLLLKIKNGEPPARRTALRVLVEHARDFGAACLFNNILPLLMAPSLEMQERHLLVKVIDRVMFQLDDLVRPFTHKILLVIEPMLVDEDRYARLEAKEIISNLSKAAGLATMISTMRPDIDHVDEYMRNTTSRAFAVVASALGIPALLPFLKAVCKSKKSWQARHTGAKIVQQIAILMGSAVLPHLARLVDSIVSGLSDDERLVRSMSALALSALAEASAPYGIEAFEPSLKPLWEGIKLHRGKGLAAFLKAVGFIIPLMDAEHAAHFTRGIMKTLIREFQTPDDEMKRIVLTVLRQCVGTPGVEASYIRTDILPDFFKSFWVRRMASTTDRRGARQLVSTTVSLADRVGANEVIRRIVDDLKDESEPFRRMVMDAIEKVIAKLGAADIPDRIEQVLIDGILFSFQEQQASAQDDFIMVKGFGTVVSALGTRAQPYLQDVVSAILWRLNNKSAAIRQQAADLVVHVAPVLKLCTQDKMLTTLGMTLYEYLGEEYPDVLASIIAALKAILDNVGLTGMNPPIKDLLPRLTPILKNRHEKVAENVVDLVGIIADKGAELVSAKEWMRICFELLDMLKSQRRSIRRATTTTFGYIAKAIGPQDVMATLLNNLKVQERTNRVATTVAIAIVAETCSPFTILPALMNEYRVPELNVQNGVLKSISYMFEYIGEMGRDYIYAVTPLLEDALIDRDLVHRQTACVAVKHMALGVAGMNCEDAIMHLFNYVWPNVFETSPQVINSVIETIDAIRVTLGPAVILQYLLQGLFHPARRVRENFWKIYDNLYIGAQDGLVPFYPRVEDDMRNTYRIHELDLSL